MFNIFGVKSRRADCKVVIDPAVLNTDEGIGGPREAIFLIYECSK